MNKESKIEENDVLQKLKEDIAAGLRERRLTLTDSSIMMTEAMGKTREKMLKDIEAIIKEEQPDVGTLNCEICGDPLKKTINEIKQKESKCIVVK